MLSVVEGGMSSKRMEERVQRWDSYSSIWRIWPECRDEVWEKTLKCSDAEGVATGIPE